MSKWDGESSKLTGGTDFTPSGGFQSVLGTAID